MRTILSFVKGLLGLAALAAFVLVLVGLFGPLSQRIPVAQQPYPVVTATRPGPPLPITLTPQPYPPPQTPTVPPPATPTFTPAPLVSVTPGPITSRLEIIWAESTRITTEVGPNQPGVITFWQTSIADLASRKSLLTMPQGYSLVRAKLSPDGSKIAFTTCTHDCRHRDAALWVVNTDGTGLKQLVSEGRGQSLDAYEIIWSPDNKTLAYMKMVPKEPPPGDKVAIPSPIFEIYAVDVDSGERKLLVSDDATPGINLLGWSPEGAVLYERAAPEGYGLWAVNRGGPPEFRGLIASEPWSVSLSPNGTKLISNSSEGFIYLSVDGKERRVLAPPEQPFGGIWSPDGAEIIGGNIGLELKALNVHTKEIRDLGVRLMDVADKLLSISPDKQWVAMQGYQGWPYGKLYLLGIGNNVRLEVPSGTDLRHESHFIGWVSARIP